MSYTQQMISIENCMIWTHSVIVFAKLYKYRAVTGTRKMTNTGKEKRVRPINFD